MNQLIKNNNHIFSKFNYFLILFLPISLLAGSLVSNITIILICLIFIIDLIQRKNFFLVKDKNFYFLIIIYIYLILNSVLISQNIDSITRAVGFIRFIFLAYAIFFYLKFYNYNFLKYWTIIFIFVSFDILYEHFFGFNIFGFSSSYAGRVASFTGDELKIGGFYFGFYAISLLYIFRIKKLYFYFCSVFFLIIAATIGEKSNFIKVFISFLFLIYFLFDKKTVVKIFSVLIISASLILTINVVKDLRESFLGELPIIKQSRVILHQIYPQPFTSVEREDEKSFKDHIVSTRYFAHYSTALEMVKKNPIFGIGLKNFRNESYKKEFNDDGRVGGSTHPHQTHFEILSEVGIFGYILILLNLIYIFLIQRNNLDVFKFIGISFIISTFFPFLPSGSFFTSYGATMFFVNYAFLINSNIIKDNDKIKLN